MCTLAHEPCGDLVFSLQYISYVKVPTSLVIIRLAIYKLDRVAPLMTDPPPSTLNRLSQNWQRLHYIKYAAIASFVRPYVASLLFHFFFFWIEL